MSRVSSFSFSLLLYDCFAAINGIFKIHGDGFLVPSGLMLQIVLEIRCQQLSFQTAVSCFGYTAAMLLAGAATQPE